MSQYISLHSDYFSYKEIFSSCIREEIIDALDSTVIMSNICFSVSCLVLVREECGVPFFIHSWYRDKRHNTIVNGSPTSDHMKGLAIDFHVDKDKRKHVLAIITNIIKEQLLPIDQFIIYPSFFHLSFRKNDPRFQTIDKR